MKNIERLVFKTLLLALGAVGWVSCEGNQDTQQVEVRYPDGSLWMVKSMRGDQLHGRSISYYPNGKIKSSTRWLNGKLTGVTRLYYPNGVLRDSSSFANDSLHGLSLLYYLNGALKRKCYFTNGTVTGTTMFFDSTRRPMQREIYDQAGKMIYLNRYDKAGKPSGKILTTIIQAPDTISWGAPYAGCVRFGYPLTGRVTMLVGTLVTHLEAFDRYQIADTLAVVRPDVRGRFCFSYLPQPAKAGQHVFGYKFLHAGNTVDSLSVDCLSGTAPFFVRPLKSSM